MDTYGLVHSRCTTSRVANDEGVQGHWRAVNCGRVPESNGKPRSHTKGVDRDHLRRGEWRFCPSYSAGNCVANRAVLLSATCGQDFIVVHDRHVAGHALYADVRRSWQEMPGVARCRRIIRTHEFVEEKVEVEVSQCRIGIRVHTTPLLSSGRMLAR